MAARAVAVVECGSGRSGGGGRVGDSLGAPAFVVGVGTRSGSGA